MQTQMWLRSKKFLQLHSCVIVVILLSSEQRLQILLYCIYSDAYLLLYIIIVRHFSFSWESVWAAKRNAALGEAPSLSHWEVISCLTWNVSIVFLLLYSLIWTPVLTVWLFVSQKNEKTLKKQSVWHQTQWAAVLFFFFFFFSQHLHVVRLSISSFIHSSVQSSINPPIIIIAFPFWDSQESWKKSILLHNLLMH